MLYLRVYALNPCQMCSTELFAVGHLVLAGVCGTARREMVACF